MMPRLGDKYEIDIETTSKQPAEYNTDEYFELDLPVAPAIMVGEEILTEGADIADHEVEVAICAQPGLDAPDKPKKGGLLGMFKK